MHALTARFTIVLAAILVSSTHAAATPAPKIYNKPTCNTLTSATTMPIDVAKSDAEVFCDHMPMWNISSLQTVTNTALIDVKSDSPEHQIEWLASPCVMALGMIIDGCKSKTDSSKIVGGTVVIKYDADRKTGMAMYGGDKGWDYTWRFVPVQPQKAS